jgi:hypothetical protein
MSVQEETNKSACWQWEQLLQTSTIITLVSEIRLKRNPALHKILEQLSVINVVLEELKQDIRNGQN